MIVVSGPGRSGTSVLMQMYAQLGLLDPDLGWYKAIRAGLEDQEVVDLNAAVLDYVGGSLAGTRKRRWWQWIKPIRRIVRGLLLRFVPPAHIAADRVARRLSEREVRNIEFPRHSRFAAAAGKFGEQMREIAERQVLVKDPQFSLTLPVWLMAGAQITDVVLCSRKMDDLVASRINSGLIGGFGPDDARVMMTFALGSAVSAAWDRPEVRTVFLRYPDFIDDPVTTARLVPKPLGVSESDVRSALLRVRERQPSTQRDD